MQYPKDPRWSNKVSQPDDSPKQMFMELSAERPFYGGDRPDLVTVERLRKIADNWGEGWGTFRGWIRA